MDFRKTGSRQGIATELTSLRWLAEAAGGAPTAEITGQGEDWLTTRRMSHGQPTAAQAAEFGRALARTHAAGAAHWGAPPPGLPESAARLAELPAPVSAEPRWGSWGEFYAEARLRPYLQRATIPAEAARPLNRAIDLIAEQHFDAPQPSLVGGVARIHGDLWGGNVVWDTSAGHARGTLIDPSAHGGHAETDLAELALFGVPQLAAIRAGYQEVSPLADGWADRVGLHQFHMLLVHAALFGGGYVSQAIGCANRLLR